MTKPINVLLIEDDADDAYFFQQALSHEIGDSVSLQFADRLEKGLECLSKGGIDLVLLDLSLPDSQGSETYVRTRSLAPNVPIIVLTGRDDRGFGSRLLQQGAQAYLVKWHIESKTIASAIQAVLKERN